MEEIQQRTTLYAEKLWVRGENEDKVGFDTRTTVKQAQ